MDIMRHLRSIVFTLACLPYSIICGQIYKYIGLDDGLSSRNVHAIRQSNGGFMWFLTDNGIDRYDGTEMSTYTLTLSDVKFTEYSSCRFIYDATADNLWIATGGGKILRYSKRNNRFELMYAPDVQYRRADIMRCAVSPIDGEGNIWILVGEQAFCYNIYTHKGREMHLDGNDNDMTFTAIVPKGNNELYIGTKGGVYRGLINGDSIDITPIGGMLSSDINVNTFFHSPEHGALLIGTEDAGMVVYKDHTGEVIHHQELLPDVRVTKIIPYGDDNQEVLFSTNAACVYRMALDDCFPQPYLKADYRTDYRMNTDNVVDMCIDKDGQLWMCSFPQGLTVRNDHYPEFYWIRRSNLNVNTLVNNGINFVMEDSEQDLWFATENGVSIYDTENKRWHTLLSMDDESPNPNHYFLTLCEVKPGIVLLGGYAAGIYIIEKATRKVKFVKPDLIVPEKYIQTMFLDKEDGTVWVGGENQLFNISLDGSLKVNHAEVFGGINFITCKDSNHLWIGTKDGLFSYDKRTREKHHITLPLERFKVNTIHQEPDGTVYIGTHHNGLLVYNETDNYYHRYNKDNSALTSNCMKCIVASTNNPCLYISSDNGIVRFNKNTNRINTWSHEQGLQGMNFNARSGMSTHRSTLMFGSNNGVIEIPDDAYPIHTYKGTLVFSDLYIGSSHVVPDMEGSPLDDAINDITRLRLGNTQRDAAIKVKCINHIYPSDCLIEWRFDDEPWRKLNDERRIGLSALNIGIHGLTVRAMSNEADMLIDERTLRIIIAPPFYLSWWGLLLELSLIALIIVLVRKYTKSTNAMQVSDEKVNFFINTAHDLRTPLSLIKAPLEELHMSNALGTEEHEAVGLALRNTNTLTQMTENILRYQLSSIEKGVSYIERHEAVAHMQAQIDKISLLAQAKHQHIHYVHPDGPFDIWIDPRKLNSIVQNLLSNAIKYSPEGETITLNLYRESKVWGFHVVDHGIGISKEGKKKLFKHYFRGSNAINAKILGSGLGLLSIARYVKQMHGRIVVNSHENCGSDFHVSFPLGKTHYNAHTTEFIDKPANATASVSDITALPLVDAYETTPSDRHRLLIVEDNPELLTYLKHIFDKEYQVFTATNGKEALAKIPYLQPTIVLSDVMMPEMRGDDLCVSIKSNIDTSHIGVVLISALADQQSIIKGLSVKADAYVTKPFDIKILQLTIGNLIESRMQLRQRLTSLDNINHDLPDATSELDLKLMNEMKAIIEAHIADCEFTIDSLAYELRVSRTTLYNKIKSLTGNNPSDLIRTCRVNRAKTLLQEHRYTVAEVADLVGFADQKYFREVFKKTVGMTPSEYAKIKK